MIITGNTEDIHKIYPSIPVSMTVCRPWQFLRAVPGPAAVSFKSLLAANEILHWEGGEVPVVGGLLAVLPPISQGNPAVAGHFFENRIGDKLVSLNGGVDVVNQPVVAENASGRFGFQQRVHINQWHSSFASNTEQLFFERLDHPQRADVMFASHQEGTACSFYIMQTIVTLAEFIPSQSVLAIDLYCLFQ